jgi:hypothetical protein
MSDHQDPIEPKTPERPAPLTRATRAVKSWPWYYQALLLAALIVIPGLLLTRYVVPRVAQQVETRADLLLKEARHVAAPADADLPTLPGIEPLVEQRLEAQLTDIRKSAHYHLTVVKAFFRYQYVAVTIASTAAVLAGLILVPISWKGWKEATPVYKTAFVIFAGLAALFTTYNKVYNQDANIASNTALYYGYLTLEDRILSYHPRRVGQAEGMVSPVELITEIDESIAGLRSFAVALDPTSVPTATSVSDQINAAASKSPN